MGNGLMIIQINFEGPSTSDVPTATKIVIYSFFHSRAHLKRFDWLPRSYPADLGWNIFFGVSRHLDEHISEEIFW